MALLAAAAAALPLFRAGRTARPRRPIVETAALIVGALGLAFLMASGGGAPIDAGATRVGLGVGLGVWALGVALAARLLRGRSAQVTA
jgi:hypothetical protein